MYGDLIFKVHLHLLVFCKYKIAYLHLLVKRKYKRKSRFFANTAAIQYKGLKNVSTFKSGRNPGSAHAAPVEPAADQPGKKKPPTPEREIGSSVIVADPRRKVAKSFGRKS
jgi:hypothetical protein